MNKNKFPFTPSQWQELEHQALVYKYMASGISIPPDLLFTIRKSFLDSPLSSRLLPNTQQHHFGWNYLQMGLGRKIDPEPGRCRRTDGKKWRCSKEAYPDSKYCERHMHRGKNRSRKPVEVLKTTATNNASSFANSSITKNSSSLSFDTQHQNYPQNSCYGSNLQQSFMYPQTTSRSSASSGIGLSFEDNNGSLFLDSNSCSQNNGDYRYVYGQKEEVDEYAFFKEPSGSTTMKSFSASSMEHDPWQLTPLTMSSSSSSSSLRPRSFSSLSNDYSCLQLQSLNEHSKQQEQEEPQKIVHRFFDELPHKGRDQQWLDLDDKSSTTQLSISIPSSAQDFPTFTSRNHHDG